MQGKCSKLSIAEFFSILINTFHVYNANVSRPPCRAPTASCSGIAATQACGAGVLRPSPPLGYLRPRCAGPDSLSPPAHAQNPVTLSGISLEVRPFVDRDILLNSLERIWGKRAWLACNPR